MIENAFLPAKEITDPERFAGRKKQIQECHLALIADGASLAILGNRGVGKSSLARQLSRMATGSLELLERYEVLFDRPHDFLCLSFTCGNSIRTIDHLLERLLSSADCLSPWVYDIPRARKMLTEYAPKFGVNAFGIEAGLGGKKQNETEAQPAVSVHDTVSVFTNVLALLAKEQPAQDGILIILDEFDQIRDKSGFASLMKALATDAPMVRFAVVGVAHDLPTLMQEHESANRLFAGGTIPVPPMNDEDLIEIIGLAEEHIGDEIRFHRDARQEVARLAQGHPYMVHLLGKHALRSAWRKGKTMITAPDIASVLRTIAESAADPVMESRYKAAIQSSPQREAVLRALASQVKNGEVWTTDAYPIGVRAGVENPSQYLGNLVTDVFGAELVKVRERYYRFRDSLFHAYVCARPPHFERPEDEE